MLYTAVCSFDLPKIHRLIDCLRKTGFNGEINLTITHAHNQNKQEIKEALDKISSHLVFDFDLVEVDSALWRFGTQRCFLSHQWEYIEKIANKYPNEWILRTDSFDVLFQKNPEEIVNKANDKDIFVGKEGISFKDSVCNQGWIPEEHKDKFKSKDVICSGVVIAKGKALANIAENIQKQQTFADQPEFNLALYELEKEEYNIIDTKDIWNAHEKQLTSAYKKGKIKHNNHTPAILHFNGGEWNENKNEFPLNLHPKVLMNVIYTEKNSANLANRIVKENKFKDYPTITAYISTKNRHHQTLELTVLSIINNTHKVDELIIIDDNKPLHPYNKDVLYSHLKNHAESNYISFNVIEGQHKNQVFNHEAVRKTCASDLILRIDDDVILEPNVIEKCINILKHNENIGALGVRCFFTNAIHAAPAYASNKLEDIFIAQNKAWFDSLATYSGYEYEDIEIEHLYGGAFFYRRIAGVTCPYELDTKKGFREETIFTNRMFSQGWKLAIARDAYAYHYQMPKEAPGSPQMVEEEKNDWLYDENVFKAYVDAQGLQRRNILFLHAMHGIGDQIILARLMPEIIEKYKEKSIVLVCSKPEIFEEFKSKCDLIIIRNMQHFQFMCKNYGVDMNSLSVYHEGASKNHTNPHAHIEDAYRAIYDIQKEIT